MFSRYVAKHAWSLVLCQYVDQNGCLTVDKNIWMLRASVCSCLLFCFSLLGNTPVSHLLRGWPPQVQKLYLSLRGSACHKYVVCCSLMTWWDDANGDIEPCFKITWFSSHPPQHSFIICEWIRKVMIKCFHIIQHLHTDWAQMKEKTEI